MGRMPVLRHDSAAVVQWPSYPLGVPVALPGCSGAEVFGMRGRGNLGSLAIVLAAGVAVLLSACGRGDAGGDAVKEASNKLHAVSGGGNPERPIRSSRSSLPTPPRTCSRERAQ